MLKIWGQVFLKQNRSYILKSKMMEYVLENNLIYIKDNERGLLSDESFSEISIKFRSLGLLEVVHPNMDNEYDMVQETKFRMTPKGLEYTATLIK